MTKNIIEAEYINISPIKAYPRTEYGIGFDGYQITYQDADLVWLPKKYFESHFVKADTYIDKMKAEYRDLLGKIKRLFDLIYEEPSLDDTEHAMAERQLNTMKSYAKTLQSRIDYVEDKEMKKLDELTRYKPPINY